MRTSTFPRPRRALVALLLLGLALGLIGTVPPVRAEAATCPCTVFTAAQTPATAAESDPDAVELGMKFRADQAGFVSGVRFYKGTGNSGTHTGSLWNTAGTRLATVIFTGETATGWQQATFATPVAVTANTTYVVSYYAPSGHYATSDQFFASTATVNAPLTGLQNGTDGGNGVYRYGTGGGYPSSSFRSTNYWVDVVFATSGTDTTKPVLTDKQPAAGATGVPVATTPTATFSEAVQPATIAMTLSAGSTAVAASTGYDAASRTVTLTPSAALATNTTYTVNLSGAKDTAGNTMDPVTWTFTTATSASGCPCTLWTSTTTPATAAASDSSAVELGVKFRASQAGYVTGIKFYKGSGNTGTHVGSLWTRTGTKLASVNFTGESATGWQTATFSAPVPVSAGTTYVASYYAPVGRYANNTSYFATSATTRGPLTALASGTDGTNGVYQYGASAFPTNSFQSSNYWVDVVFNTTASDTVAPTVLSRAPAPGSSGASTTAPVTATFSEPVSSVSMVLKDAANATVPATFSYDSASQTASLTPNPQLANSATYSVTVSGATDGSGNVMAPDTWSFTTAAAPPPPPDQGPGGPIALVTSGSNPYSKFLAEILRTEGLNEFTTIDVGTVNATTLAGYDVVVLGNVTVSSSQVTDLTSWVTNGGNLVAMRPGANLSPLLGLSAATGTLSDAYLKVDPATAAGAGIESSTIQFHGPADNYTLNGATAVASLYANATTATPNPAVTLRNVGGAGGQAAAFTFDLPRSIALTRQGNPAWAGTERDGLNPIRSDDFFFGGSSANWIDFAKVAIPQADEQQRLLGNLIQVMNRDKKPLPRFWYFPKQGNAASGAPNLLKAVLVGTGDDHGNNGTAGRFNQFIANSPAGCSVTDWTCYRYSSYLYPNTPLANTTAKSFSDQGFEVGVHESTGCNNYTPASLADTYAGDIAQFKTNFPSLPNAVSTRMHCIAFSDWASQPKVEVGYGIRTDTNYYYWPDTFVQDRPGFMTGSGMPMRFTDTDGTMIDNYQAATQMTDESGQTYPFNIDTLLNNAQGATGYYGAFVANFHTDLSTEPESDALLASAKSHNVPIISGKQLSSWLDGRNGSSYSNISWSGNTLSFGVSVGTNATGLTGMLPTAGPGGTTLTGISKSGTAVPYTVNTIKGLDYATFNAAAGGYTATYGGGGTLAVATAKASAVQAAPVSSADLAPSTAPAKKTTSATTTTEQTATVRWRTTKPATSKVLIGTSPTDLEPAVTEAGATTKHAVAVTGLKAKTTYYYRVVSTDTAGKQVLSPAATAAPLTLTTAATDLVAPVPTDPVITPLPDGTAVVSWTTDVAAAAGVRIGDSSTKTAERKVSAALTTSHEFVLTNLQPGRTYIINTVSQDKAGNRTISKAIRFITPALGIAQQTAESFRLGELSGDAVISDTGTGSVTLRGASTTARSGTFVSGVLDAHELVDWDRATVSAQISKGTKGSVSVRLGSTPAPDGSWTDWTALPTSGPTTGRVRGSSRFLQYRIEMAAPAGVAAPALYSIGFSHNGAALDFEKETG